MEDFENWTITLGGGGGRDNRDCTGDGDDIPTTSWARVPPIETLTLAPLRLPVALVIEEVVRAPAIVDAGTLTTTDFTVFGLVVVG